MWAEVISGWNEIYESSPKTQKFFEDAAPTIAKLGVSLISGSQATGDVVGNVVSAGAGASSTLKKAAGVVAYGAAVGFGTGVIGLAATALAPIWIPIAIYSSREKK